MADTAGGATTRRFRVLVVDDEPNIRAALIRLFRLEGYDTGEAESGPAAITAIEREPYDLMILDLNLPGIDGTEVMRQVRGLRPDMQIVVLTGHPTLDSAIAAIRLEAVDYIQKPARLEEIAAIVRRALRARTEELQRRELLRMIGSAVDALRKEPEPAQVEPDTAGSGGEGAPHLTLESDLRRLVLPGETERTVELTDGEMAVLEVLMNQPDQVISCRQIVRLAWNYDVEEWEAQNVVRPHIFRLRHKMETDPDHPRWLKTVRGRGYLFSLKG